MKKNLISPHLLTQTTFMFRCQCILAAVLIFTVFKVNAQNQNHVWPIVPHAITFNNTSITNGLLPFQTLAVQSQFPANTMQDAYGQLLFSVVDGTVSDAGMTSILEILNPDYVSDPNDRVVKGNSEVVIVAVPGNCHKYYIISSEPRIFQPAPDWQPYYIRLNVDNNRGIELQDANGNPSSYSTKLSNYPNNSNHSGTLHMAITPLRPATNDRLLFIVNALDIYEYIVNDAGITYLTTINLGPYIEGGQPISPSGSSRLRSELDVVCLPNGDYKLGVPILLSNNFFGYQHGVVVYDLNSNGGVKSSLFKGIGTSTLPDRPVGIEFTPDGQYLYISKTTTPFLVAMNTASGALTDIIYFGNNNPQNFNDSQIELATNGLLYIAAGNRLSSVSGISDPATAEWLDPAASLGSSVFDVPGINLAYSANPHQSPYGIRYLPDQIDGENYLDGFLLTDLQCCVDHSQFDVNDDYTAPTGTYTWTNSSNPWNVASPIRVRKQITIPSGANVTIQDMTFMFGYEGAVEIQKNAVLTMLGTKFTNTSCDIMWLGVNVLGTPGNSSLAQNGVLSMSTSAGVSSIENAQEGVSMFGGGQLLTFNALFKNNWHSINIWDNDLPSGSLTNTLNGSNFINTGNLFYPHKGATDDFFINLRDVNNISFVNVNTFSGGSLGILSNDSKYNLSLAQFTDVTNAIWSKKIYAGYSSEHIFTNNIFQDCFSGIRIDGGYNDLITDNIFNPSNAVGSQNTNYFGVQMESSGAFKILDNTFNRISYAVNVNNSVSLGGRISTTNGSGNQFESCWRGVNAGGDNSVMQIKCNVFENNQVANEYSTAWYVGGKLANQGSNNPNDITSPAGNKFFSPSSRIDLYSLAGSGTNGLNFTYFYHSIAGNPELLPTVNNSNYIEEFGTGIQYDPSQSCLGVNIMTLANNIPLNAKFLISAQPDPVIQQLWENELIYWYDTSGRDLSSIRYLKNRGGFAAEKVLFDKYIKANMFPEARHILNANDTSSDVEIINYVAFNRVLFKWAKQNRTAFNMTPNEEQIIRDVSESKTSSAVLAQGILNLVFGEPYLLPPADSLNLRLAATTVIEPKAANPYYLSPAYPNPTNSETIISYVLPDDAKDAQIIITDLLGRPKQTFKLNRNQNFITVSTYDLAPGTYTYRLLINGATVGSHTFIVLN